jgi:hypothetical protein
VKFVQTELTEPLQNAITLENVSLSLSSSSCICTGLSALSVSYLFIQCLSLPSLLSLSLSLVSYYIFLPFFYYLFQHSLTISFSHPSPLYFLLSLSSILLLSHFLLSLFRPPPLVLASLLPFLSLSYCFSSIQLSFVFNAFLPSSTSSLYVFYPSSVPLSWLTVSLTFPISRLFKYALSLLLSYCLSPSSL